MNVLVKAAAVSGASKVPQAHRCPTVSCAKPTLLCPAWEELDVLEDTAEERGRLTRKTVKDSLDLFLTVTWEKFTSRFKISKQSTRAFLVDLHLFHIGNLI